MTQPTLAYTEELRLAIRTRTDRVHHLQSMIDGIRRCYRAMSPDQLNEAIRDVNGMKREIAEHRDFCEKAKKEIASYYASPVLA